MTDTPDRRRVTADPILLLLLGATVAVPALAMMAGLDRGEVSFVSYREPKLIAISVLGWSLLAALFWLRGRSLDLGTLPSLARRPELLLLILLPSYLGVSLAWITVPENGFYELRQYLLLVPLVICLLLWQQADDRVATVVRGALVASLAAVTAVGLIQMVVQIPVLPPINPYTEVEHPSLMGYKNPMALALLGQLFLLTQLAIAPGRALRPIVRYALVLLLVVEFIYLITLESRSAYLGLSVAILFLIGTQLAGCRLQGGAALKTVPLALAIAATASVVGLMSPAVRSKAASALGYLASPASYLDSDRGTYLLNTLAMVRTRPLGVGLGDWQTAYPVYRRHNRELSFSGSHQVRRAHSDHVQMLGEGGWPGLLLWLGLLTTMILRATAHGLRSSKPAPLFAAAQLVALSAAMCTDYFVELPYGKFQLMLVLFLCVAATPAGRLPATPLPTRRVVVTTAAMAFTAAAVLNLVFAASFVRKLQLGARLTRQYLHATAEAPKSPASRAGLREVVATGTRFVRLSGHTKTMYRDYLLIADASQRLGDRPAARALLQRSLSLHPHHPQSFELMSRLVPDPKASVAWARAAEYIWLEAADGFRIPYPPGHPLAR